VDDRPFRVLFVCTANICRSAMAQLVMTDAVAERWPDHAGAVQVSSAGTRALVGQSVDPPAGSVLAGAGIASDGFRASALLEWKIAEADLVLTATRQHRDIVLDLEPAALARTFTLRELARLAPLAGSAVTVGSAPAAALRALVAEAALLRGTCPPIVPGEDDLADPHGRPTTDYEQALMTIRSAVEALIAEVPTG